MTRRTVFIALSLLSVLVSTAFSSRLLKSNLEEGRRGLQSARCETFGTCDEYADPSIGPPEDQDDNENAAKYKYLEELAAIQEKIGNFNRRLLEEQAADEEMGGGWEIFDNFNRRLFEKQADEEILG